MSRAVHICVATPICTPWNRRQTGVDVNEEVSGATLEQMGIESLRCKRLPDSVEFMHAAIQRRSVSTDCHARTLPRRLDSIPMLRDDPTGD